MTDKHKEMFDLFATVGWREFIRERQQELKELKDAAWTITNEQELYFAKGKIQVLMNITHYQEAYRQMVDEEELPFESDV